jgi:multimeric flavodoxin WrbA
MAKAKRARKSRKVVILLGSPRKRGNSAALAERIAEGARSSGAEVTSFYLHGMKIAPCNACEGCHQPESTGCVIKDDMQKIYPKLVEADAIVYASPIYWFTLSAQLKLAIDRCYALGGSDRHKLAGKRMVLVFAYGGEDPFISGCTNAIRTFQDAFAFIGAEIVGMVYASAGAAGDIKSNTKMMDGALDLGRKLVP